MRLRGIDEFLVVDLEATCWPETAPPQRQETIEIAAVRYRPGAGIVGEHNTFVRPVDHPALSAFCTELTGIAQEQVDAAPPFRPAFVGLKQFAGDEPVLCSWSDFDRALLASECQRHGIDYPFSIHIDLAKLFGRRTRRGYVPLHHAIETCALEPQGRAHSATDDARNLARLLAWLIDRELRSL